MSIGLTISSLRSENLDVSQMTDSTLQQYVQLISGFPKETIRAETLNNKLLETFITSDRFLLEYARQKNLFSKLPPTAWLQKQLTDGSFHYENLQLKKKDDYRFDLVEILFDETRHGYAELDCLFDILHGIHAVQDTADCVSDVPLRNVFVFGNLNLPVVRFDPALFVQNWVMTLLRPKWVFRGLIACPKGDYGLVNITMEVHNSRNDIIKNVLSLPFKQADEDNKGRFIPFEVCSADYSFRPFFVFVSVMVFHVNKQRRVADGIRFANCTIQAVLPDEVTELAQDSVCMMPNSSHDPTLTEHLNACYHSDNDPKYVEELRDRFNMPITNTNKLALEKHALEMDNVMTMLNRPILEEKMELDVEPRKRNAPSDEGEPEQKRRREMAH